MASFPSSIVTPTDPTSNNTLNSPDHAGEHQSHNAEIVAIETKIGIGSSTATVGKVLRATGTGTSGWGQVAISTDVASATSADLRSILSDETGTGVAVFGTTPSLITPQITTSINDSNGNEVIKTPATGSATNEITVTNAANGSAPTISATGSSDTNVDLKIIGKGTGKAYPDSITEFAFDFIVSGLVWSGDAYASTLNASMTAGFAYISGVRVTIAAITARAFTASKDTYIDLNSSGTITYTEVTNNAASPALSANNIRIGIVISGAGNIAAATSINQGQTGALLPIASSQPYETTDSLGNLIYPKDPQRRLLGYRQITNSPTTTSTTAAAITGLSMPIKVPAGRKVVLSIFCGAMANGTSDKSADLSICDTSAADANRLVFGSVKISSQTTASDAMYLSTSPQRPSLTTETSKTYLGCAAASLGGTTTIGAAVITYIKAVME